ncbi:MAG: glycosyltransferase family 4 protein [Candidatus Omnitrophica bacterium]|nr:glycosyltransferase family 4 protein [Candidatus Omnitrophota bacterium]
MVKVLRVITRLNIGGPAIHTLLLSSSLNNGGGYKDILVCGRVSESEGDMSYLAREKNVEPVVIDELGREISFVKDTRAFFKLCGIMKRERPAIVHTHTAKAGTLGRLAAILTGVPVRIHTFHGHVFDGYFSPHKAKAFVLIEKFLARFTSRVIMVSEGVRNEIVKELKVASPSKSVVIPLGLELEQFLDSEKRKGALRLMLGIGGDVMLIGIVGRLVPIKNHKMFLDAAKKISDRKLSAKVKFLVIGDGELKEDLAVYAKKLGIEKDVIFTGWVQDLPMVYADLDIVALTSLNEGTPVSLIEAMASARAVIATSVGGVGDLIADGSNGVLTTAQDTDGFSGKLLGLIEDRSGRLAMGGRAREFVRDRYSKQRLVGDIKKLYEECLCEKNGRR